MIRHRNAQKQYFEEYDGSGRSEDDDWDVDSAADARRAGAPTDSTAIVASDWLPIADFENQVNTRHPAFGTYNSSRLRGSVRMTPCDLFLAFFPSELVEPSFEAWREHPAEHDRNDLSSLNKSTFMTFLALLLRGAMMGLRRRHHYFTEAVTSAATSQNMAAMFWRARRACTMPVRPWACQKWQVMPRYDA
jgi:hypothetical protein